MPSLIGFFALTFAVTWTCFLAAMEPAFGGFRTPLLYLGIFGPAIVALLLTARAEGSAGAGALLRRVVQWRVGVRWYGFAVVFFAAIKIGVALIHRVIFGAWPRFGTESFYLILIAIPISTIFQAGEEIGWRGYALPRLAASLGVGGASIVLGILWAAWHLPLFYFPGADTYGQSFPLFLLQVTALSVALAWLYLRTEGSLLLTMLMHSAVNQTKDIVPSAVAGASNPFALSTSRVAWLTVTLLWACAVYFLTRMRGGLSFDSAWQSEPSESSAGSHPNRPSSTTGPSSPNSAAGIRMDIRR